ncbi:hypothetical protein LY76DRAFT_598589 [Colletotrichum caudatum]|nr:hypothetical protein LY76DRAFT_598589 [Colletotrichum caudatum]
MILSSSSTTSTTALPPPTMRGDELPWDLDAARIAIRSSRDETPTPPPPMTDVSVLRFSVRILSPTTTAMLQHVESAQRDGGGGGGGGGNAEEFDSDTDAVPGSDPGSPFQIQSIELCFNSDFSSSGRPISIRFATTLPNITHTLTPPSLAQPTPPHYIHEIPNILDLTRRDSCRGRPFAVLSWLCILSLLLLGLYLASLCIPLLSFLHYRHQDTAPPAATAPTGDRYILAFSNVTKRVPSFEKLLPLLRLRFSLASSLDDVLAAPTPDFGKAAHVSLRTHGDLTSFLWDRVPVEPHTGTEDLLLTSSLLGKRAASIAILWRRLCSQHLHASVFLDDITFALYLTEMAPPVADRNDKPQHDPKMDVADSSFYTRRLRDGLFTTKRVTWLGACQFCRNPDDDDTRTTTETSHDTTTTMPSTPAAWHFACLPQFCSLSTNSTIHKRQETTARNKHSRQNNDKKDGDEDAITSFLLEWAASQSARRFTALRSAPIDLNGEPIYHDNQHPFTEADEIASPDLPGEDHLFALLRQLVELIASIDEVVACINRRGILQHARRPRPINPSSTHTKRTFAVSRLAEWLFDSGPAAITAPTLEETEAAGIAYGVAFLSSFRNDTLLPLVRALGPIAAGASYACTLSTRLSLALDTQSAGQEAPVVNVVVEEEEEVAADGVPTSRRYAPPTATTTTTTTTINVQYVTRTTDIAVDVAALRAEFETMRATADRRERAREPRRQQQREAVIKAREKMKQEQERWRAEPDSFGPGPDATDEQSDALLLQDIAEGLSVGSMDRLADSLKGYRLSFTSDHEDQG